MGFVSVIIVSTPPALGLPLVLVWAPRTHIPDKESEECAANYVRLVVKGYSTTTRPDITARPCTVQ